MTYIRINVPSPCMSSEAQQRGCGNVATDALHVGGVH